MAEKLVDPARLEGEQLRRWYLRSSDDTERERQASATQRHADFFGGSPAATQKAQRRNVRPTVSDMDGLWVAKGYEGYRPIRPSSSDFLTALEPHAATDYPGYLPQEAAAPEAGEFVKVGNPHNPRLRREWELANAKPWPKTVDGRAYHVSHRKAIADGGTNTLDNVEPMDPDEHMAKHRRDKDSERFGKRAAIARAYGGRVEPPAHGPKPPRGSVVKGLGIFGLIPNITGLLSGRIRTDTPVHFWNDMLGYSSEDDLPYRDLIA